MLKRGSRLRHMGIALATLAGAVGASLKGSPAGAEAAQVYCTYQYFGTQYQMCLPPPVAEAKKACEAKAQEQHGEKLECFCTDDPEYVGDFCKQGQKKPEKPEY